MTYLSKEMTLDVRRNHTLCGGCRRIPKGALYLFDSPRDPRYEIMLFELDPPKVWLDSHFDLNSPASLVWNEFGHFTSLHHDACPRLEDPWPFEFPKWSREHYYRNLHKGCCCLTFLDRLELEKRRKDRRIKKKAQKSACSRRHRGPRLMPGAWIA